MLDLVTDLRACVECLMKPLLLRILYNAALYTPTASLAEWPFLVSTSNFQAIFISLRIDHTAGFPFKEPTNKGGRPVCVIIVIGRGEGLHELQYLVAAVFKSCSFPRTTRSVGLSPPVLAPHFVFGT